MAGNAPYVTGATNAKNPAGNLIYRNIGDQQVPVRITDYGPGAKGLDIASSNKAWAKNFPYQGHTDTPPAPPDSNAAATGYLPGGQPYVPGGATTVPAQWTNYAGVGQVPKALPVSGQGLTAAQGSAVASGLGAYGKAIQQQGLTDTQKALSMLQSDPRAAAMLKQLASNPWMYLAPVNQGG